MYQMLSASNFNVVIQCILPWFWCARWPWVVVFVFLTPHQLFRSLSTLLRACQVAWSKNQLFYLPSSFFVLPKEMANAYMDNHFSILIHYNRLPYCSLERNNLLVKPHAVCYRCPKQTLPHSSDLPRSPYL